MGYRIHTQNGKLGGKWAVLAVISVFQSPDFRGAIFSYQRILRSCDPKKGIEYPVKFSLLLGRLTNSASSKVKDRIKMVECVACMNDSQDPVRAISIHQYPSLNSPDISTANRRLLSPIVEDRTPGIPEILA